VIPNILKIFPNKYFHFLILSFISCALCSCDAEKSTINRGHRWFDRGKYENAVQTYSHALEINPANPDTYYFRGLAKLMAEDLVGAKADFNEAIRLNPNYLGAYINRGIIFKRTGELDKALKDINKAIELKPNEYKLYSIRAGIWFQKGRFDESIADCNIIIKNNPQTAVAYRDRADAYYWKRDYKEAIKDYSKAVEINQKDSYAYNNLAWILATCKDANFRDGKSALVYAKKAVDLNPSKVNLGTNAAACAENGMFDEAIKIMKKIVAEDKEHNPKNKKYLDLFQRHQPLREKSGD
jgi:tetratricopeptide (TPR) repeat protein